MRFLGHTYLGYEHHASGVAEFWAFGVIESTGDTALCSNCCSTGFAVKKPTANQVVCAYVVG